MTTQPEYKKCPGCNQSKSVEEFNWRNKERGTRNVRCKECTRKQGQISYNKRREYYVSCNVALKRERRRDYMGRIWDYLLNHPYVDCGEENPIVLDFDHRDPSEKTECVSKLSGSVLGWDRIWAEIQKCDVRCANCHRIKTAKERGWYAMIGK